MKNKYLSELKKLKPSKFLFLTVAGLINAFGVTFFLNPAKMYDSGISGTSMLLAQITPEAFSLSLFLVILNVPLFLFGLRKQGLSFTVYSLYAVVVYSLGAAIAGIILGKLPSAANGASPFAGTDPLLCAVFGGVISGIGSGLTIRFGGAIDGIEVMAVIFAKRLNITVGTFVMIYNIILYIAAGILSETWTLPLYSILAYAAAIKVVDFIVEGFDRSKEVMIITERADEISDALIEAFESGTTKIAAKGGYSNADKTVIYFVVNRFQISRMKDIVYSIDPNAYFTISEVADVYKSGK